MVDPQSWDEVMGAEKPTTPTWDDVMAQKPVEGGLLSSAKQIIGTTIRGAGQLAGDITPGVDVDNPVTRYGQSVVDANPTAIRSLEDIAERPGKAVAEATGNAAGSVAGIVGVRLAGQAITAASPLAGPAAPAVAAVGQLVSWLGPAAIAALPSYSSIRDKQLINNPETQEEWQEKAKAALGAATVGVIETKFGPQNWALLALTKEGRASLAKKFASETLTGRAAKGILKGGVAEGSEELVQNPIEQFAAGDNPLSEESVSETLFGGAMGAIGGGVLGGGAGAIQHVAGSPKVTPPKEILDAPDVDAAVAAFRFEVSGEKPDLTELRRTYKDQTPEETAGAQSEIEAALQNDPTFTQDAEGKPTAYGAPLRAITPQELPSEGEGLTRDAYEAIAAINSASGLKTVVYKDHANLPDGLVKQPDVVFVSSKTSIDPVVVAAHEAQHLSEEGEPQSAYAKIVQEELTEKAAELARERHGEKMAPEQIAREIRADITGDAWADPTFHGRVIEKMRVQLGEKQAEKSALSFLESIKNLIERIKQTLTGTTFTSPNGQRLATQYVKNLERVHDALAAAIADQFLQKGYRPPGAKTNTSQIILARALEQQAARVIAEGVPAFQRTIEQRIRAEAAPVAPPLAASPELVSALAAAAKAPFDRTTEERLNLEAIRIGVRMSPKAMPRDDLVENVAQARAEYKDARTDDEITRAQEALERAQDRLADFDAAFKKALQASPKSDRAKLEASRAARTGTLVNIGLNVGDKKSVSDKQALAALKLAGVKVLSSSVQQSDTEATFVGHLDRALTPEEAHAVAVNLKQEAIAQISDGKGELYGPKADGWRPFNPEFFFTPDGKRLSEAPKRAPAVRDSRTAEKVKIEAARAGKIAGKATQAELKGVNDAQIEAARIQPDEPARRGAAGEREQPGVETVVIAKRADQVKSVFNMKPDESAQFSPKTLETDMRDQSAWLDRRARDEGYESVDALPPERFTELAAEWRAEHPRISFSPKTRAMKKWLEGSAVRDVVYHGTSTDFTAFNTDDTTELGAHFGTTAHANDRVGAYADSRVIPVYLNLKNPLRLIDEGTFAPYAVAGQLADLGILPQEQLGRFVNKYTVGVVNKEVPLSEELKRIIERAGYDGVVYLNRREGYSTVVLADTDPALSDAEWTAMAPGGGDSYIAFHPNQIKSVFNERPTKDSNISMSPKTPEFKKWFGKSKAVDDSGKPLVVYHGTSDKFTEFDKSKIDNEEEGGFFFTDNEYLAQDYGDEVMQVYLSLQNPYEVSYHKWSDGKVPAVDELKAAGHDGVIITDFDSGNNDTIHDDRGNAYLVFEPNQIKSIFNERPTDAPGIQQSPKIVGDSKRPYTPEQRRLFQNVGRSVEVPTLRNRIASMRKDLGMKMAQGLVDQFAPLKALSPMAYMLARLSKGSAGALEALLHHGKLRLNAGAFDADRSGGFIQKVGIPLRGELEDFLWWVAANRAELLTAQDRERLFSRSDITAGKSLANGNTSFDYVTRSGATTRSRNLIYADALKNFEEFNRNALDMAEQSGLIDPTSRKIWENEFYVPFYRVSGEDGGFIGGSISNALVRQRAFKHLKGGEQKLHSDLLANTIANWAHLIDASAKNRAAKASLEAAANMGVAIEADAATVAAMGRSISKSAVWFMDGGLKRHYLVDDPFVLTAITSLEYSGMKGPLMDAMSTMKHVLTVGVTASPFFKIKNLIRDSLQALAVAPIGANPLANIREGIAASEHSTQTYVSALASGGLIRFGTMLEGRMSDRVRQLVKSGVKETTILNSDSKLRAMYDRYLEPAVIAYNELGNRSEEITRAALYKQLTDKGMSHAEASLMARDLMDFSLQGSWSGIRFLTQVVPFMNARMQGLYKLGRGAAEDPRRFAAVIGATAMFSIALMAAYGDDDDWKKREEWDRDNFWWFKVGGTAFRIPKPFEVGAIATLAERGLEYFTSPEMTGERFRKVTLDILANNLSMNPVPQLLKPIVDIYANQDSFTGRPIETLGMERLEPDYRFNARTSVLARAAGAAGQAVASTVGADFVSPLMIDHALRGYFGWLGSFIVGTADLLARPLTGEAERPAGDLWKFTTGNMIAELPTDQSRYVSHMYEQARAIEQAYGTFQHLLKQGRPVEAREFLEENRDKLSKYRGVQQVKRAEGRLNERIRIIERSRLDPEAKRVAIAAIAAQKDRVARLVK